MWAAKPRRRIEQAGDRRGPLDLPPPLRDVAPAIFLEEPTRAERQQDLVEKAINTIRMLSADAVQQANSGHPGMPMGAADMAFVLWTRHMRRREGAALDRSRPLHPLRRPRVDAALFAPAPRRLRLHDRGPEEVPPAPLAHARSPEFGYLPGVEVTSGPLGQGFANGVGFALGQAMLSAKLGPGTRSRSLRVRDRLGRRSHGGRRRRGGDFAGHNGLGRLVYLYDDNEITIDGNTSIAFTGEDVTKRFEGYGWHVQTVDGRDLDGIDRAIQAAKAETGKPSLVRVRTTIGFGSPGKAGKSSAHGAPLGDAEEARRHEEEPGLAGGAALPRARRRPRVLARGPGREGGAGRLWRAKERVAAGQRREGRAPRRARRALGARADPGAGPRRRGWRRGDAQALVRDDQKIAPLVPSLVGGSADLAESNLTDIKGAGSFSATSPAGRNVH